MDTERRGVDTHVLQDIKAWRIYHFHDTSDTAHVKRLGEINDNLYLRPDARNLAAFRRGIPEGET